MPAIVPTWANESTPVPAVDCVVYGQSGSDRQSREVLFPRDLLNRTAGQQTRQDGGDIVPLAPLVSYR